MATLTKSELLCRMGRTELKDRLVVTPILDDKQVGNCSIDLRLNNQFILFRSRSFRAFDPGQPGQLKRFFEEHCYLQSYPSLSALCDAHSEDLQQLVRRYQEKVVVPFKSEFVLHPHELVLGSSLEYMSIPTDLEAQVEGRSSWARLGLVVASANTVDPGFQGVVTFELRNLGTQPLVLWPGMRVACLVLHTTTGKGEYKKRKYRCPVGPDFSKLHEDSDDIRNWVGRSRMEELGGLLAHELIESEERTAELLKEFEDRQPSQGRAGGLSS